MAEESERERHLESLYKLLTRLEERQGGKRRLAQCHGRMIWPQRGVYFFFEPGESRAADPLLHRVVRVGTHAVSTGSGSTLWGRLRQHRGDGNQGGNHRGSIFRLHVGTAIIERDGIRANFPNWGNKSTTSKTTRAAEAALEKQVSEHLGKMTVLFLAVDDPPSPKSRRAMIESNVIALLSNVQHPVDGSSSTWLGRYSTESRIRQSGLWNLNYVENAFDPSALDVLQSCIDAM